MITGNEEGRGRVENWFADCTENVSNTCYNKIINIFKIYNILKINNYKIINVRRGNKK